MSTPTIVPPRIAGEALTSYAHRLALLNGWGIRATARIAFGEPWRAPGWRLPDGLREFGRVLEPALALQPVDWLLRHTLAPYYAVTFDADRRHRLYARLLQPSRGPRQPFVALGLDEWFARRAVVCPVCDEDHRRRHGFSAVQRHWLLPFVTRCEIHSEVLRSCPAWSPTHPGAGKRLCVLSARQVQGKAWTLQGLWALHGGNCDSAALMDLLAQRRLLTVTGHLRRDAIVSWLATHLPGRVEHPELQSILKDDGELGRLLTPLGSPKRHVHPVLGLHMLAALQDEEIHRTPVRSRASEPKFARKERAAALHGALLVAPTATQVARIAGVCVTTAVVHALAAGKTLALRPKRLRPPLREAILQALERGRSIEQAARLAHVSTVSVYRVLRTRPGLAAQLQAARLQHRLQACQARWSMLMLDNPNLTGTQVRALAAADYAFLYRHARPWLQKQRAPRVPIAHPPTAKGRAPAGADAALADGIRAAAILDPMKLPPRTTVTALLQRAGLPKRRLHGRGLPNAVCAAAVAAEPLNRFVYRRLSAAAAHLKNDGRRLHPFRVARESGLRPETICRSGLNPRRVIEETRAANWERLGHAQDSETPLSPYSLPAP